MTTIPITSLTPDTAPPTDNSIRAIVTLFWPYSSSTRQCALLLADPDFRLRNRRGQVRVRFTGASAEAVAKSHVGIGDEVVLSLGGAVWEEDVEATKTPGKSVDGELLYRRKLDMRVLKQAGDAMICVNAPISPPASPKKPLDMTTATPLSKAKRRSHGLDAPTESLPSYTYTSPAFVKRLRLSGEFLLGTAYDPFEGEDAEKELPSKRQRTSFGSNLRWRYAEKSPSPTKDTFDEDARSTSMDEPTVRDAAMEEGTVRDTAMEEAGEVTQEQTAATMPPPPLPRLEMPPADAIAEETSEREQERPVTPQLQPVKSPTLPLPSPFPADTHQQNSGLLNAAILNQRRTEAVTTVQQDQPDSVLPLAQNGITDDAFDRNVMIEGRALQSYHSDTEPDDETIELNAHSEGATSADDSVQDINDEDMLDGATEIMYEDEAEEVIEVDDDLPQNEDDSDSDEEVRSHEHEKLTQQPKVRKGHLVDKTVSKEPHTPPKPTVLRPMSDFGLDGTTSTPPSAHVTPQSEKDRVMKQTYRSLFGFRRSPAPQLQQEPQRREVASPAPGPILSTMVRDRLAVAALPSKEATKLAVEMPDAAPPQEQYDQRIGSVTPTPRADPSVEDRTEPETVETHTEHSPTPSADLPNESAAPVIEEAVEAEALTVSQQPPPSSRVQVIDLGSSSDEEEGEGEEEDEEDADTVTNNEEDQPILSQSQVQFKSPEVQDSLEDSETEDLLDAGLNVDQAPLFSTHVHEDAAMMEIAAAYETLRESSVADEMEIADSNAVHGDISSEAVDQQWLHGPMDLVEELPSSPVSNSEIDIGTSDQQQMDESVDLVEEQPSSPPSDDDVDIEATNQQQTHDAADLVERQRSPSAPMLEAAPTSPLSSIVTSPADEASPPKPGQVSSDDAMVAEDYAEVASEQMSQGVDANERTRSSSASSAPAMPVSEPTLTVALPLVETSSPVRSPKAESELAPPKSTANTVVIELGSSSPPVDDEQGDPMLVDDATVDMSESNLGNEDIVDAAMSEAVVGEAEVKSTTPIAEVASDPLLTESHEPSQIPPSVVHEVPEDRRASSRSDIESAIHAVNSEPESGTYLRYPPPFEQVIGLDAVRSQEVAASPSPSVPASQAPLRFNAAGYYTRRMGEIKQLAAYVDALESRAEDPPPLDQVSDSAPAESQELLSQARFSALQAPSYPSLPLSPSNSQSLLNAPSQTIIETSLPEAVSNVMPPTPRLTQKESSVHVQESAEVEPPLSQMTEAESQEPDVDRTVPSMSTKTPSRKSLSNRISNVPDVISAWFSPKRSSGVTAETIQSLQVKQLGSHRVSGTEHAATNRHTRSQHVQDDTVHANGFSTSLAYFTALSTLDSLLNSSSQQAHSKDLVDVMAIVSSSTKEPTRAKGGPRDHFTLFHISDSSISDPAGILVEVFRPWIATLPVAQAGDVVLLRAFTVRSRNRQAYLLSTDTSAWCVWRYEGRGRAEDADGKPVWARRRASVNGNSVREEVKGPPVELGDEERKHAAQLRQWWLTQQNVEEHAEADDGDDDVSMNGYYPQSPTAKL